MLEHPRRWRLGNALWLTMLLPAELAFAQAPIIDLATVRPLFENLFEQRRVNGAYGQYRMRAGDTSPSYYGSLDVAISRAVMGEELTSTLTEQQRSDWIAHLHTFANPDGTFENDFGHSQLHRNGMTIRGLSVLGGKQLYPVTSLYAPFDKPHEVASYLSDQVNWVNQWSESHKLSGGFHPFSQSSRATPEWNDAVFEWLDANIDSNSGWWRIGEQPNDLNGLGGGAHIWPLYEHLGHEFQHPERVVDRILDMQVPSGRFGGNNSHYMDLDALYGLKYMRALAPDYRRAEVDQAVGEFGTWLAGDIENFLSSSPNLHNVLAKVSSFGMLNQIAPERFPDSSGAQWLDYFTDDRLYQTAAVETFVIPTEPVGQDDHSNYSAVVLADGPVGYWRLGQTGGVTALEATGKSELNGYYVRLGTGSGEGNLGQTGPRSALGYHGHGEANRAIHLDGDSSVVSISDQPPLDLTGAITLESWIRLDAHPDANGGIVAKFLGEGNQRSYQLFVHTQSGGIGSLGMVVSPDGQATTAGRLLDDQPLPLDEWLHVVGVFEPDEYLRLYINGELVEQRTTNVPGQAFESDADLWIGRQFSTASNFHLPGSVDEVAIYDRALSDLEILTHYEASLLLPGDYNRDGVVDAADYTVWRNSLHAQTAPLDSADGDGDGRVTLADYSVWREHYGREVAQSPLDQKVPEPAAMVLALMAGIAATFTMQHRQIATQRFVLDAPAGLPSRCGLL